MEVLLPLESFVGDVFTGVCFFSQLRLQLYATIPRAIPTTTISAITMPAKASFETPDDEGLACVVEVFTDTVVILVGDPIVMNVPEVKDWAVGEKMGCRVLEGSVA